MPRNSNFSVRVNPIPILIAILGMLGAVYVGAQLAKSPTFILMAISGFTVFTMLIGMEKYVWLMVPFTIFMEGYIPFVPSSPYVWQVAVVVVAGVTVMRICTKGGGLMSRWTLLDTFILLNALVILQAAVRNPLGFYMLGGDAVGGKKYIEVACAITGFAILSIQKVDIRLFRIAVLGMIVFVVGDSLCVAITGFVPGLGVLVGKFYSNIGGVVSMFGDVTATQYIESGLTESRLSFLGQPAEYAGLIAVSFFRPITCLCPWYPLRFALFMFSLALTALSGFRSRIIWLGEIYAAGTIARKTYKDLFVGGVFGLVSLALVVMFGLTGSLPKGAQRSLSFLPIEVDQAQKAQADESANWRFDMWKTVLTEKGFIQDKIWGDGFTTKASEMAALLQRQLGGFTDDYNFFLYSGTYHGFHVEAIRCVGVVGLVIATATLIYMSILSLKLINYFRGRREFSYVLFVTIPFIFLPLHSWLIFGSYRGEYMTVLLSAGMLKMLDNIRYMEIKAAAAAKPETGPLPDSDPGANPLPSPAIQR